MKAGLACLLAAVFFAIVAGGHVTLDAQPEGPAALGVVMAFMGACCCAAGLNLLRNEKQKAGGVLLLALAALFVVVDFLIGGEMFATVRTLAAVLTFGGLTYVLATNRVVQLPTAIYAGFFALLVSAMGVSILVSEFKWVSADAWLYWLTYGGAFYLTVATVGRVKGPRMVLESIVFATALVSLKGIIEYLSMRATEPTYRIFADWNNPNALAGILAIGVPLTLGLGLSNAGRARTAAYVGAATITTALVLTASKGGLLVTAIGLVVLFATVLAWKGGKRTWSALLPLSVAALLVGAIQVTTPKAPNGAGALARVGGAGAEQAQSLEYRKLLWRGAIGLAKDQPVGYGAGTYRYYSAKSGLNEQTQLAHQSFLQIAVEGGVVAFIGIVGLALVWTVRMFMGARALDTDRNLLRAAVLASVVTAAADGMLESNVFYLGTGLVVFVLLGLGLQLAADGTSPESLPPAFRGIVVLACCVVPMGMMIWVQWESNAKTSLATAAAARDMGQVRNALDILGPIGAYDGEAWYLRWLYDRDPSGNANRHYLEQSIELAPTTKSLRALAQRNILDQNSNSEQLLQRALTFDPNNLRTLKQLLDLHDQRQETNDAIQTARRIIAVEETPYLQVRALPEYVPTEPLEARAYLAAHETDNAIKKRLLREALDGYLRYKALTVPQVKKFATDNLSFVGDNLDTARTKMEDARKVADDLAQSLGSSPEGDEVRALAKGLTVD